MKFFGKKDTDMTQGNVYSRILYFAVPMMLGLLFQQLYNTVDTWVVGKFVSKNALAAVGCNGPVINTVVGAFAGLATGASVLISQAYGAHDNQRLSRAVHTTMAITLILCLVGTAVGLLLAKPLLLITKPAPAVVQSVPTDEIAEAAESDPESLTGLFEAGDETASELPTAEEITQAETETEAAASSEAPTENTEEEDMEEVFELAEQYLLIYFAGLSGLLIYNMGTGILRAVGDSTRPLYYLVASAVSNTVLDLLFVLVFHWGVAGVALATIIAEAFSSVLVLRALMKTDAAYGFRIKELCLDREIIKSTLRLGLPSSIQSAVTAFSNVFVQKYINALGSVGMAGWTAYNKLDAFLIVPVMAISMAATTFVGQCWGAKKPERAREGVRKSMILSLAVTLSLAIIVVVLAGPLMGLFTNDDRVLEYGKFFVMVISPFYVMICFNQIYAGVLRGIGIATAPTVVMLGSFVVFRQIYLYIFSQLLHGGRLIIALAYPLGWVVCSSLLIVLYLRSPLVRQKEELQAAG